MATSELTAAPTRRHRVPVLGLLTGNAISLVGNQLTGLAIPWFVLVTTGSAAKTGLVAFFGMLPAILAAFLGGAIVDRVGSKRMSVVADVMSGLTVAAVPLLYHTVGLGFAALIALVFLGALLDAPGNTARTALLPDLAAQAGMRLERANSAAQVIQSFSTLLGPPLAGALIAVLGPSNVLWVDAATFAVSAVLVGLAVPAGPVQSQASSRYWDEVMEGLRFLREDRLIRSLIVPFAIINFLTAPLFAVILPVLAKERYGSAQDLGLMFAGFGAGALVVSLGFGAIGHRLPRRATLIGAFVGFGLPIWVLAMLPSLAVSVAALVAAGLAIGAVNPLAMTMLQERVPVELRGRVFGAVMGIVLVATPLGMLLAGTLIAALGLRLLIAAIAALCLATGASLLFNPALRETEAFGVGREA